MDETRGHDTAHPGGAQLPEQTGLTKLEHFAALMLSGIVSRSGAGHDEQQIGQARDAVRYAQALIAALNEQAAK